MAIKIRRSRAITPLRAARGVGLRALFVHWYVFIALIAGLTIALVVPGQNIDVVWNLLRTHFSIIGFSFASFTLLVLGGGDDFIKAGIQRKVTKGDDPTVARDALRNLIFSLYFPLPLQVVCIILLLIRLLLSATFDNLEQHFGSVVPFSFRSIYAFFTVWAALEIMQAVSKLYGIFNLRVGWQYDRIMQASAPSESLKSPEDAEHGDPPK